MYKLTYFKAKNVIGFLSGMGMKTFELDLHEFKEKDIIVIFGDNASGKSTFLSLVHPWHLPSDGRSKFIIPGKEGTLIREYESDDGTVITTKCVYSPKGSDSDQHSAKCFFAITKPSDDEPVELNPTGNVTSYQALLYTYFGINKEFLNFSTYNNAVAGIISMTDGERKNSVSSLVPNMGRFEVAYATVNEKYKELRNLIRNVSQKILQLRDEESLKADLKRISKEVDSYVYQREDQIKRAAKIDGRLKELTKGGNSDDMVAKYNDELVRLQSVNSSLEHHQQKLYRLYVDLGIEFDYDHIPSEVSSPQGLSNKILNYARRVATTEAELSNFSERQKAFKEQLADVENQLMELETTMYSIQTTDLDSLMRIKQSYERELSQLQYKDNPAYEGMSYDEVTAFSNQIVQLDTMIQAMYDEYGELITTCFQEASDQMEQHANGCIDSIGQLKARIETNSQKKDYIYRKMVELEQYQNLQKILDQRPKSCTIDNCPFIANALKWEAVADEIERLKSEYEQLGIQIAQDQTSSQDYEKRLSVYEASNTLILYMSGIESQMKKYLGISIEDAYEAISKGTWKDLFDIYKLKEIASILSEKDRYRQITHELIPEVNHNIEIARMYEANQQLIKSQLDRLGKERSRIKKSLSEFNMHVAISSQMLDRWKTKLTQWKELESTLESYNDALQEYLELTDSVKANEESIRQIKELKERKKELKRSIEELTEIANHKVREQDQVRMELVQLEQLHLEKLSIEQDFLVVDVIRSIIQPGKGLRKELINIYMFDIYQTANQLLLHTFNGNLYLKEFIITDKEFIIPYVYNGTESPDIALASASQQSAISISISMAILSKIMGNYGIACFDEADAPFSPANRSIFIDILTTQIRYIGLQQCFFITQHQNEYTESDSVGFIAFPGGNTKHIPDEDLIVVK